MPKDFHHAPLAATVLLINDRLHEPSALGRAMRDLIADLQAHHMETVCALADEDGTAIIRATPQLAAIILDWDLHGDPTHEKAAGVLKETRARNIDIPVFLLAERSSASRIEAEIIGQVEGFIWLLEDTMEFISERVAAAVHRYRAQLLPPMFSALVKFAKTAEYSWHTPGHTGGTAFLRSPAGRMFHEFFGEALFRSDLSISVGDLGSLLDHSGPIGAGERYAAKVFGADRTYYVTNGTSTSNRVVMGATIAEGDVVLCDRNCHKSVEHGLTLTGAKPVYLMPHRNHLGLIGPIPPARLSPDAISRNIAHAGGGDCPALAVVTNSTYDGLCYNAARVEELLSPSVDRLLFDEAWFAYARFNPVYAGRFAMRDERTPDGPTVFATQSTHKLLAALSQASMIHMRDGRAAVPHARFNEAFMMHASTSPQYAIIASADVSAAMMAGNGGRLLTAEAIAEAVSFRQMMARLHGEFSARGDWFFSLWQPEFVADGADTAQPFAEVAPERLGADPTCWELAPGAAWHGFAGLEPGYCMLDPIKVSLVTPGIDASGLLAADGIPAPLVTAYLAARGIVAEKTTNFTILFLFSIGVTKGKWGSLVSALIEFKRDFDANARLAHVLPELVAAHPETYAEMGLRDLAHAMFGAMRAGELPERMARAYDTQPQASRTPAGAYRALVHGKCETVALGQLAGGIAGTAIVPYPPGIPLVMPGEFLGAQDGPILLYLKALEAFDRAFPGFGHDTHGIEVSGGAYYGTLLKI